MRYSEEELADYENTIKEIRSLTQEYIEEEYGEQPPFSDRFEVWVAVQSAYGEMVEYESLDDYAKLAQATYEMYGDRINWSEFQDRVVDYTLERATPRDHHVKNYLPGHYTVDATEEIVLHAVREDLCGEIS